MINFTLEDFLYLLEHSDDGDRVDGGDEAGEADDVENVHVRVEELGIEEVKADSDERRVQHRTEDCQGED